MTWWHGVTRVRGGWLAQTNKYAVKAGQDQAFWEDKGWIHEQDPRGWFQWYW